MQKEISSGDGIDVYIPAVSMDSQENLGKGAVGGCAT